MIIVCREHDFSVDKFDDRTVIICDQVTNTTTNPFYIFFLFLYHSNSIQVLILTNVGYFVSPV